MLELKDICFERDNKKILDKIKNYTDYFTVQELDYEILYNTNDSPQARNALSNFAGHGNNRKRQKQPIPSFFYTPTLFAIIVTRNKKIVNKTRFFFLPLPFLSLLFFNFRPFLSIFRQLQSLFKQINYCILYIYIVL